MTRPYEPTEMPEGLRFRLALALISTIRFLVPGDLRSRWTAEWRAEIWHRARRSGSLAPTFAALPHAASLRRQHWSPETMVQDFRYALRQMRNTPGLSALIVLTMALGIGANSLVYSVLDSTVLHPLPFDDADRLVYLWRQHPSNTWSISPSMEDIVQWREQVDGLERIETMRGHIYTLSGVDEPLRVNAAMVGAGLFELVGAQPALGRTFVPEERTPGAERVAVISHRLWRNQFGGAEDILGRVLRLDEELHTIVGVMPASFRLQSPFALAQVWTPLVESEVERGLNAIALLERGTTIEQVNQELAAIASPEKEASAVDDWIGKARRPADFLSAAYTRTVWSLQGAVGIVLLIAIANVVNLLLSRGSVRQQEMAVRAAIGGSRGRLVRQLLTESMLLTVAGGALGLSIAVAGVQLLDTWRPENLGSLATLRLDPSVLVVTLGATVLAGLTAGLLPALHGAGGNLQMQMAALSGRASEGRRRRRARSLLVVGEVALSTVLVVTAGLLVGSFLHLQEVDPGFDAENVLTMRVSVSESRYQSAAEMREFWADVRKEMRTAIGPRAEAITLSVGIPPGLGVVFGQPVLEDGPLDRELEGVTAAAWVESSYFDTLGMRWSEGGTFPDSESGEVPLVVSDEFAAQVWPGEEALGKRIRFGEGDDEEWRRVVGVVGNVKAFGLMSKGSQREIYSPLEREEGMLESGSLMVTIRAREAPLDLAPIVRQAIWNVDAEAPVTEVATMRERLADSIALPRFNAMLMASLAVVALGLALVGVYGVLSYAVARRTHELGVRMALGATRSTLLALVGRTSLGLVGAGLALGVVGGAAASRLMTNMLHGVEPSEPSAYLVAAAALGAVGVFATWLPAARATRVDPAVALRDD